jgi:ribonucleoside-triphosphate reductase
MKKIKTEIYSRVCGFFRPVSEWNKGKQEEFKERKSVINKEVLNNEGHNDRLRDFIDKT